MGNTGKFAVHGAIAGMIAGMAMAMYAMIASATFLHEGFFTPLYGIAAPIVGKQAMVTSMSQGIYFTFGPAIVGLIIHMMVSAVFGIIYGFAARALHLAGFVSVVAGMMYGVVILLVMSFVALPIIGLGSMPATVGWPSFTIEHLMYGVVIGLWPLVKSQEFAK